MDQHYGLTLVAGPSTEPLTVAECKPWLHVDDEDSSQDAVIRGLIQAARDCCERVTGRALVTQTWRLDLDAWPEDWVVRLPKAPLQSVSGITYVDADGVTQTIASGNYRVDAAADPGRIEPAWDYTWPVARGVVGAIRITFVCGYGAASAVPAAVRERLQAFVAARFERREEFDQDWLESLFWPFAAGGL